MSREGRQDLYRLAALLSELRRILNPLPRGSAGEFQVEMMPPPPLPPTGVPGLASGQPTSRAPARTAVEWASLAPGRPPPRAPSPMPPWIEPPPLPQPPVAEPEAAAPDQRDREMPGGAGGSAAARMPGPVASLAASFALAPIPGHGGRVPPLLPDEAAPEPAQTARPIVPAAAQAEIAPEAERRMGAFPGIAVPQTASPAPDTAKIAAAAPSSAVTRSGRVVAPPLHESGAPPVTTPPAASDEHGGRLPAPVRLPREPVPGTSPAMRVPPPRRSPSRRTGDPGPDNRSEPTQPPLHARADPYPPPATGEPITIDVPRLDAPIVEASADVSPSEPPPAETLEVAIEETVPAPLSESPGRRLLVWRGRILGDVRQELRDAARTRFERRFVPRLALRLP